MNGLMQGSVISPLLFNIFIGAMLSAIEKEFEENSLGIEFVYNMDSDPLERNSTAKSKGKCMTVKSSLFADDSAWYFSSQEDAQLGVNIIDKIFSACGQIISIKKTELLVISPKNQTVAVEETINIQGQNLVRTNQFKYVGSLITEESKMMKELNIRIARMEIAYAALRVNLFENKHASLSIKLKAYNTFVLANATYGSQTWNATKDCLKKLDAAAYRILMRIFKYSWWHHVSYVRLIEEAKEVGVTLFSMEAIVRKNRLLFFSDITRMEDDRLLKQLLYGETKEGKRSSGGQQHTFIDCIRADLRMFGIGLDESGAPKKELWGPIISTDRKEARDNIKACMVSFNNNWCEKRELKSIERHRNLRRVTDETQLNPNQNAEDNINNANNGFNNYEYEENLRELVESGDDETLEKLLGVEGKKVLDKLGGDLTWYYIWKGRYDLNRCKTRTWKIINEMIEVKKRREEVGNRAESMGLTNISSFKRPWFVEWYKKLKEERSESDMRRMETVQREKEIALFLPTSNVWDPVNDAEEDFFIEKFTDAKKVGRIQSFKFRWRPRYIEQITEGKEIKYGKEVDKIKFHRVRGYEWQEEERRERRQLTKYEKEMADKFLSERENRVEVAKQIRSGIVLKDGRKRKKIENIIEVVEEEVESEEVQSEEVESEEGESREIVVGGGGLECTGKENLWTHLFKVLKYGLSKFYKFCVW